MKMERQEDNNGEKNSRERKGRNKEREQGRQTSEVLELGRTNLCYLFFRVSSPVALLSFLF